LDQHFSKVKRSHSPHDPLRILLFIEGIWKDGWESNKWKIGDLKVAYREK
jgi:hypothetical protein